MKLAVYQEIVELIHGSDSRQCLEEIRKKYPDVSMKTMGSIYSQEYQKKMKKVHYKHNIPEVTEDYYQRYLHRVLCGEEHVILKMAGEVDLSPVLLARMILERHLSHTEYDLESPPKSVLSAKMKDPGLIEEPVLASEINVCLLADENYGHYVDSIKHSVGHEYECLLKKKVDETGLAYLDEDQMRLYGYDKTPDVKLEVPIAVDGYVINWIESKASFGDEEAHRTYLKDQFWSYWNRFGPGLVIYWFGFIDELNVNQDKGILLSDKFPENIVMMNPRFVSNPHS